MKSLRLITNIHLIFYGIFILLNLAEFGFYFREYALYGGKIILFKKARVIDSVLDWELWFHTLLNYVDLLVLFFQIVIYNAFVKKYTDEKSVRVLWIFVAFIPLVHYFWGFIIWRKLNRSIFTHAGKDPRASDRKIVVMWGLILVSLLAAIFSSLIFHYLVRVGPMGSFQYERLSSILNSACILSYSVIGMSYFIEFHRKITRKGALNPELSENQLLDE
ncbi:hypothetical protein [Fluviicola sp.]|uniref:hypothetical protein n=1 Tax=Fluviicola sp. TaxID=1917219 RepID=UPI0031D9802D